MGPTVHVKGAAELEKAFRDLRRDVLAELRPALLAAAEPVRRTAEEMAAGQVSNMTEPWSRMRVGATARHGVYVAPKSRRRGGSPRPNFGGLLLSRALLPAVEEKQGEVVNALEAAVTVAAARQGFLTV